MLSKSYDINLINEPSEYYARQVKNAVIKHDLKQLKILLGEKPDLLNLLFDDGVNILHLACMIKSKHIVKYLIEETSIDINSLDSNRNHALNYAIYLPFFYDEKILPERISVIKILLDQKNIDIDHKDKFDNFFWRDPAIYSHFDSERTILLLLKAGISTGGLGMSCKTLLFLAILGEFKEIIEFFFLKEIHKLSQFEKSHLVWCAIYYHRENSVNYLLKCGINLDIKLIKWLLTEYKKCFPYEEKISELTGKPDPQKKLYDLKIKKAHVDNKGRVSLYTTYTMVSLNIQDQYGRTPLHISVEEGVSDLVEELLDHGADPNILDEDGQSPLLAAVTNGSIELVELLLKSGADPKISPLSKGIFLTSEHRISFQKDLSEDVYSPFHTAIAQEYWEIAKLFIKYDPILKDDPGSSLLHYAALHDYFELAKYLIEKGHDVEVFDSKGRTFFDVARENASDKFMKIFLSKKQKIEDYAESLPVLPQFFPTSLKANPGRFFG